MSRVEGRPLRLAPVRAGGDSEDEVPEPDADPPVHDLSMARAFRALGYTYHGKFIRLPAAAPPSEGPREAPRSRPDPPDRAAAAVAFEAARGIVAEVLGRPGTIPFPRAVDAIEVALVGILAGEMGSAVRPAAAPSVRRGTAALIESLRFLEGPRRAAGARLLREAFGEESGLPVVEGGAASGEDLDAWSGWWRRRGPDPAAEEVGPVAAVVPGASAVTAAPAEGGEVPYVVLEEEDES